MGGNVSKKVSIGLDIGSSAVRAAEVVIDGEHRVLRRFAQVGLPSGVVVEGEVHDRAAVAAAIKKLWQHGRFAGKKVVVGIGSQRAMVRQVEMPPMPDSELRSALKLKIGEFLPIPVEQAVVDFAPLPGGATGGEGAGATRRVLLVAAQRDVVTDVVDAVEAAGLRVEAVDSSSLALLRAVAQPGSGGSGGPGAGLVAVVGIGAELITVAVRDGGTPRFMRTVSLSGNAGGVSDTFASLASAADRSRPGSRAAGPGVAIAPAQRLEAIVSEVRSSLEYLLSQSGTGQFEQVLVTGGGAMLPGVTEALSSAVGLPVRLAESPLELDTKGLALEHEALSEAQNRWLTAVGLALWGTDAYGNPSLMPAEISAKRQQQRAMMSAAATVVVLAAALGVTSYTRIHTADNIQSQIRRSTAESVALQARIKKLGFVLRVPQEVQTRRGLALDALYGDINWIGMMNRLAEAMPSDVTVQSVTLTKADIGLSSNPIPGSIVGGLQMMAKTTGGSAAVAAFIDRVSRVKGLFALWVSSTTNAAGVTQIQASAELTTGALGSRAAAVPGLPGGKI